MNYEQYNKETQKHFVEMCADISTPHTKETLEERMRLYVKPMVLEGFENDTPTDELAMQIAYKVGFFDQPT